MMTCFSGIFAAEKAMRSNPEEIRYRQYCSIWTYWEMGSCFPPILTPVFEIPRVFVYLLFHEKNLFEIRIN